MIADYFLKGAFLGRTVIFEVSSVTSAMFAVRKLFLDKNSSNANKRLSTHILTNVRELRTSTKVFVSEAKIHGLWTMFYVQNIQKVHDYHSGFLALQKLAM